MVVRAIAISCCLRVGRREGEVRKYASSKKQTVMQDPIFCPADTRLWTEMKCALESYLPEINGNEEINLRWCRENANCKCEAIEREKP